MVPFAAVAARGGTSGAAEARGAWFFTRLLCLRKGRRARASGAMASTRVQKIMTQPINLIFRFLQQKARVQVWLYETADMRMEGVIVGFDEFMNLVLDDAEEVHMKAKDASASRRPLGRILLKGDTITLLQQVQAG